MSGNDIPSESGGKEYCAATSAFNRSMKSASSSLASAIGSSGRSLGGGDNGR